MTAPVHLSDVRLTIRLSSDLHARLRLFAMGRSNGSKTDLSAIVREALEHYLTPRTRQTASRKVSDTKGQR
jgi:predicted transcriptional regulator